jgi:hypothetical protein
MYSMGMDPIFEVRDAEEGGYCARFPEKVTAFREGMAARSGRGARGSRAFPAAGQRLAAHAR